MFYLKYEAFPCLSCTCTEFLLHHAVVCMAWIQTYVGGKSISIFLEFLKVRGSRKTRAQIKNWGEILPMNGACSGCATLDPVSHPHSPHCSLLPYQMLADCVSGLVLLITEFATVTLKALILTIPLAVFAFHR